MELGELETQFPNQCKKQGEETLMQAQLVCQISYDKIGQQIIVGPNQQP